MKTITIPTCSKPFVVYVNGKKYSYPAGTEQEVPDEVAHIIEQHYNGHEEKHQPVEAPFTATDGGVSYSGPQALTEEQKTQARENIGVNDTVLFSEQSITVVQKAQARENVGLGNTDTISNHELTELWAEIAQLRGTVRDWPTLKGGALGWYGTGKNNFGNSLLKEVHFVKNYTPTGNEDDTWAADADGSGSITGYRTGTVVTISANGSDKMRLAADSAMVFGNLQLVTTLTGLELLDASNVTTLYGAFFNMNVIKEIDISSWLLPKVTNVVAMCNKCYALEKFKFSRYGTPNIENDKGMFSNCPNLTYVDMGRGISLISEIAFEKCLSLEKVVGLDSVTSIGDKAFIYAPKLKETDLRGKNITSIGASAFRLSNAEDVVNLSAVPLDNIGDLATRHKRWSASTLEALKEIEMPDVYIDVPNTDNQSNYADILFGTQADGTKIYIPTHGCFALAAYHAWNAKYAGTDQEYSNFEDWWNAKEFPTKFVPTNDWSQKTDREDLLAVLGWSLLEDCYIGSTEPLRKIVNRLAEGFPVFGTMHSANVDGKHSVLIVGCNSETRKLAVLDSNVILGTGTVSWVSYEDVFTEDYSDADYITLIDYGT